jgi:CheY-like chemotaxis protein
MGKLLIVDDHPLNLKLVRVLLEAEGHDVTIAVDAPSALRALESLHPDLILLDIQLPGVDGLELAQQLKGTPATSAIPIIAVTAYAMKGDEEKVRAAGCNAYVSKPIDTRALVALVARLTRPEGAPS